MKAVFRWAAPQDASAIAGLFEEMLRTIYGKEQVEGYPSGYLDRFFSGGEDGILVAECQSQVVGFLSLESHRETPRCFLYLDDFSVTAAYRGQGLGSHLLDLGEEYAARLGLGEIHLHVERDNLAARRLYQSRGFELLEDQGARLLLKKDLHSS